MRPSQEGTSNSRAWIEGGFLYVDVNYTFRRNIDFEYLNEEKVTFMMASGKNTIASSGSNSGLKMHANIRTHWALECGDNVLPLLTMQTYVSIYLHTYTQELM